MGSNTFTYIKYDEVSIEKQERCKELCDALEEQLGRMGAGRYQSLALTALETAYMWIGKAIRDEQIRRTAVAEHKPERGE